MKKTTLIRNEAPHAVNMPEGSKLAARKTKKAPGTPVPQEGVPAMASGQAMTEPPAAETPPAAPVPPSIVAKPRPKARLKSQNKAAAPPASRPRSAARAQSTPPPAAPEPVDEAVLWEADNPVKNRMDQLQTRNDLLREQLQRLQPTFQARGKQP